MRLTLTALALGATLAAPAAAAVLDPSPQPVLPAAETHLGTIDAMSSGVAGIGMALSALKDRASGEAEIVEAALPVPVPAALPLLLLGLGALGVAARRRN